MDSSLAAKMQAGYLTPAHHVILNNTPIVRLHVGLPSVRQIIQIPAGYAIHYSQLLNHHIRTGVMNRGPTLDIELTLSSPKVIGMLVFIWLTGSIGGWPGGVIDYPTKLSDDDSAHNPPMDENPETDIELVFEVCRVGASLLMNTELVDICAAQKLGKLLEAPGLPRDTITVEQAAQIFQREGAGLSRMKSLVAKWFARDYAVGCLERERLMGRSGEEGGGEQSESGFRGLYEGNRTFAYMVDYFYDLVLAGSRMGRGGKRVGRDLISGEGFTLMEGEVWREVDGARFEK